MAVASSAEINADAGMTSFVAVEDLSVLFPLSVLLESGGGAAGVLSPLDELLLPSSPQAVTRDKMSKSTNPSDRTFFIFFSSYQ